MCINWKSLDTIQNIQKKKITNNRNRRHIIYVLYRWIYIDTLIYVCLCDRPTTIRSQPSRLYVSYMPEFYNETFKQTDICGWMDGRTDGQSLELEDLYTNIYRLIYRFRFFVYCVLHMYDIYLHLYGSCQPFKVHCGSLSKSDQSHSNNLPA